MTILKKMSSMGLASLLLVSTLQTSFAACPVGSGSCPIQQTVLPSGTQVTFPAGSSLVVREVGYACNIGESFSAQLSSPIMHNGVCIVPAGTTVHGKVTGVDPAAGTRSIQLENLSLPNGTQVAFDTTATAELSSVGVAAVQQVPLSGSVQSTGGVIQTGASYLVPQVSLGPEATSPVGKVVAGTLGGAAFGAVTGTLAGMTMAASADGDNLSGGSGAARGLAWGSAYGAGLGLLSGLIAAALTPSPTAVSSTAAVPVAYQPSICNIVLAEPVTFTLQ